MISDEEWSTVPTIERGAGKLNPQPLPVNASVSANVTPSPPYALATRTDDTNRGLTPDVTYVGEADPGSLPSDPVWRIKRISDDGSEFITIQWAGGVATFSQIWDNRTSLTYS